MLNNNEQSSNLPEENYSSMEANNQHEVNLSVHTEKIDTERDNFDFLSGLNQVSIERKTEILEKLRQWEKDSRLDLLRSAGLDLNTLKKSPLERHIILASSFLKLKPSKDKLIFECDFQGNDFAQTQIDLSDLFPANILIVDIFDTEGNLLFKNAKRNFIDGKPCYTTSDNKKVYLRDGFTIHLKETQSSLALIDLRQGQQTHKHNFNEQIYLTENQKKIQITERTQEIAKSRGRVLITTPEFYDQKLPEIIRDPQNQDAFKDGKINFDLIFSKIEDLLKGFGVFFDDLTQKITKNFNNNEDRKLANPIQQKPSLPPEDLPISTRENTPSSNNRLVNIARSFIGSTNFRGPEVGGGNLACAQVASFILKEAGLIDKTILNVDGVEQELLRRGWTKHNQPAQSGDVVLWGRTPARVVDGIAKPGHRHIGIMTNAEYSVNNNSSKKVPLESKVDFNSPRGVYLLRPPSKVS